MYYCNTCSQLLCGACRETTHKAKMLSSHDIVSLAKRTMEAHKIMSRAHCIDIETAYMQSCERLDQAVISSLSVPCHSPAISDMSLGSSVVRKPTAISSPRVGRLPFTEHCRNYENSCRVNAADIHSAAEGLGAGDPQGSDQAPLPHQDRHHGRHPGYLRADGQTYLLQWNS
ncbi:unnamed protein product [Coregonus sp. 'balchen']|nr:unnamed protein product [Coregonus sp. 'balchen']